MLSLGGTLNAQTPMPVALEAHFDKLTSDFFYYIDPDAGAGAVRVGLSFSNGSERSVTLTYFYKAGDVQAVPGELTVVVPVSYQPTAVCRRAGKSDTFYVAGWAERPTHTILEEWTLVGGALGVVVQQQGGGVPVSTLVAPSLEKSLLLSTGEISPISSVAFNRHADSVWMLEEAAPKRVWNVPVATPNARAVLFDSTGDPTGTLATATSMTAAKHPLAGQVIWFEVKRKWVSGILYQEPYYLRVFRDTNADGAIDVAETTTLKDLFTTYPPGTWINKYP